MKPVTDYEPRFDIDYEYGRQGELLVADLLTAVAHGDARVEVKSKRRADEWLYVEYEQQPFGRGEWKPSGIVTTEAEVWVYNCPGNICLFVPVAALKEAARVAYREGKQVETVISDNPTRGVLVNMRDILRSQQSDTTRSA